MFLLIGLGNPGPDYHHTRHNAGFLVINELAKRLGLDLRFKRALEAEIVEGDLDGKRVVLCKPQAFMNVSGRAVQKVMKKFPVSARQVLVVYDDADLSFGDVRFKEGGTSAGHRGMQSILDVFPTGTNIARVRVGIGRPDHSDIALEDFVLQKWTAKEETALPDVLENAIRAILAYAGT